jgi:hypothetical protein
MSLLCTIRVSFMIDVPLWTRLFSAARRSLARGRCATAFLSAQIPRVLAALDS